MFILCDTSSVLMLLRIAPEMFSDRRYECVTIRHVHDEIVRTAKFKNKYPWAKQLRAKIRPTVLSVAQKAKEEIAFESIRSLNLLGCKNKRTDSLFDLSFIDMKVISHAIVLGYNVTSGDGDLNDFCRQEFGSEFRGTVSPLEILNRWLDNDIIEWDDEKHRFVADWAIQYEHPQPGGAKKKFRDLTGRQYPGS